MRAIFGVLSLLIVVAVVGMLAKKQLRAASVTTAPAHNAAAQDAGISLPVTSPGATPQAQSLQIQQQVQQKLQAIQQNRPMPDAADRP
ncbi:MAG: hypothetical protein M3R45_03415 [Pseudomonadota bacterium]|nr:hypothetical protein [Pseudomonadota bacterium]